MRYLRLYLYFLRFSFSRAFEFRLDFYFRVVMDCVYYAVNLAFFGIVFTQAGLVGGWTLDQATVFVCGYLWIDAVHMSVFANNMWMLPILINKGDLDYYLVRPVSSMFFVSLRDFAANSFLNLLIASALLWWSLWRMPEPLGAGRTAVFLLLLLNGCFVCYLVRMVFITPVFWTHSGRGFDTLYFSLQHLSERPHQIFAGWLRLVLTTVLPLALFASVPAHALFSGLTLETLAETLAVTVALYLFVVWFWRLGLRAYTSASS